VHASTAVRERQSESIRLRFQTNPYGMGVAAWSTHRIAGPSPIAINHLKPEACLNNILEFSPYRKENTTLHHYKDQLVDAVSGNTLFTVRVT
jgi:hypothetical protein